MRKMQHFCKHHWILKADLGTTSSGEYEYVQKRDFVWVGNLQESGLTKEQMEEIDMHYYLYSSSCREDMKESFQPKSRELMDKLKENKKLNVEKGPVHLG